MFREQKPQRLAVSTIPAMILATATAGSIASPALAASGPEWMEPCDAGALPADADPVTGPSGVFVETITGNLFDDCGGDGGDYQDVFLIEIAIPSLFSARLDATRTDFDTQLWLFEISATGLLGNDDDRTQPPFSGFGNVANDGSGAMVTAPGRYYLAISGYDSDPLSGAFAIFDQATRIEVSGPDGPGGSTPVSGWTGPGAQGTYAIDLTGVVFIDCPGDLDADGVVGFSDILVILGAWGPCAGCPEDLDSSGAVDFGDILTVLAAWGPCV